MRGQKKRWLKFFLFFWQSVTWHLKANNPTKEKLALFYESNDNNLRKCSLLTQLNLVSKALQLVSWASKTDRQIDDTKATHLVYSHCSPWQPKWLQPGALISKHFLVCVMYLSPILRWCSEENFWSRHQTTDKILGKPHSMQRTQLVPGSPENTVI